MHDVPQRAGPTVADRAQNTDRVGARAVRVVGLQEDPYAVVGRVLGGRAQPPGRRRVRFLGALVGAAAGEDTDEGGAQVAGEFEERAELREHGFVVARRRDAHIPGEAEDLDAGRLELGGHIGSFGEAETEVDGFFGVRAQFDAVIAVGGREPQDIGDGETGHAEGGERQFHKRDPIRHSTFQSFPFVSIVSVTAWRSSRQSWPTRSLPKERWGFSVVRTKPWRR